MRRKNRRARHSGGSRNPVDHGVVVWIREMGKLRGSQGCCGLLRGCLPYQLRELESERTLPRGFGMAIDPVIRCFPLVPVFRLRAPPTRQITRTSLERDATNTKGSVQTRSCRCRRPSARVHRHPPSHRSWNHSGCIDCRVWRINRDDHTRSSGRLRCHVGDHPKLSHQAYRAGGTGTLYDSLDPAGK
jgi:hypothetical protein